jgi:hypothetical protein
MKRPLLAIITLMLAASAGAQQLHTYVHTQTGPQQLPLGYPVPMPVASLTPVDGFRDYASLHARLQSLALVQPDIAAHVVGNSMRGREVWAYVVGSAGSSDAEGRAKPAFFINATTHAREWGVPEVATGLVERMAAGSNDGGLVRYLLDNTRLVIIPVQNVDGFLQTQRYPDQVLLGLDPCSPGNWPRDGRMRRKNLRNADEDLFSLADHLNGVDLNRNHPPFWSTASATTPCSSGSSPNPASLVFHGPGAHTESEHHAMLQAATLAPASRIRLGIDIHSYTRVFFSSNTGRTRLNAIQAQLLAMLSAHHANVPAHDRPANGAVYRDVPDPPNRGIGTAQEYFAYEWLVPAWTLEIEPGSAGARDYGAPGQSHDGFILPNSEVRRVRETWAESHLMAFYFMAGPPHLARMRLFDADSGELLRERRWLYEPTQQRRVMQEHAQGAIEPGQRLRAELSFSKPMRHRINGGVTDLPGVSVPLAPHVWQTVGDQRSELATGQGRWTGEQGWRYRDDSYEFVFEAPDAGSTFALEVQAQDMVGLALDAQPATPVDWLSGAWSGWQDSDGVEGDQGGIDRATAVVASAGTGSGIALVDPPRVVGEGDVLRLRLNLSAPSDSMRRVVGESVQTTLNRPLISPPPPPAPFVEWLPGETGERVLEFAIDDDTVAQGERPATFEMALWTQGAGPGVPLPAVTVTVLDNDGPQQVVMRLRDGVLASALAPVQSAGGGALVLDGGRAYDAAARSPLPTCVPGIVIDQPVVLFGNGAEVVSDACAFPLAIRGPAQVTLDHVTMAPFVDDANLRVRRSVLAPQRVAASVLDIERSWLLAPTLTDSRVSLRGSAILGGTTLAGAELQLGSSTLLSDGRPALSGTASGQVVAASTALHRLPVGSGPICEGGAVTSNGRNHASDASCGLSGAGDSQSASFPGFVFGAPGNARLPPAGSAIDAGGACPEVDLRGTPRPQTMTAGATPRCDIGAIELGINPYRGMWIPDRPGHGIDMHTAGNRLFLLWYTFDDSGEPTVYQAIAPLTGRTWQAPLQRARRDLGSGQVVYSDVGQIGIDFDNNTEATLRWQFSGRAAGSERMQAYLFAEGEPRFEVTGTWFPPAEPGNGATIVRRGEVTAAVIYYHDAAGNLRWALGTGSAADAVEIELLGFTGFCPDCDAAAMPLQHQPVGTALFHFLTPHRARVDTDLQYPGSAGGQWTRTRAQFVPLNDLVNNRHPLQQN